jgi:putative sugar O-methyltransferase
MTKKNIPGLKPTQSVLWRQINKAQLANRNISDLTDFKSSSVNFRLTMWNPRNNGMRYLKTLIYNLCALLTEEDLQNLSRIRNRKYGNPIAVCYNRQEICLDYLQAIYELGFLQKNMRLDGSRILEIGAGYGRTAHAILSNHPTASYVILDLKNCLDLARKYLGKVLNKSDFSRISFVSFEDINSLNDDNFDLCINIDSFAEMEAQTVHFYLGYIDTHCRYLYVKNPVGKYLDKSLDNWARGSKTVRSALSMGLLRDVIDIHDNLAVKKHAGKFLQVYKPGTAWKLISDSWALPWSYYWQAVYKKDLRPRQPAERKNR